MEWVLDASLALALVIPDEHAGQSLTVLSPIRPGARFWVPPLWWYEVANALVVAERRKRLSRVDGVRSLALYGMLPIQTDAHAVYDVAERVATLAQHYVLSAYDAAYLELAERKGIGLATLDQGLSKAARKMGIKVYR